MAKRKETSWDRVKRERDEAQAEAAAHIRKIEKLEAESETDKQHISVLLERITSLSGACQEYDQQIRELQKPIDKLTEERDIARAAEGDLAEKLEGLQQTCGQQRDEIIDLRDRYDYLLELHFKTLMKLRDA